MLQEVEVSWTGQVDGEWMIDELHLELLVHVSPSIKWQRETLVMRILGMVLYQPTVTSGIAIISITMSQFLYAEESGLR